MTEFANLQGVLNREFREPLSELIPDSNPTLAAINKVAMATDRIWIKGRTERDYNAGPVADGWNAVTSGFGTDPGSSYIAPVLDWATYKAEWSIPKRTLAQVANNPGVLGDLLYDDIAQATRDLANAIAQDLYAGSVANGLVGAQALFDDANTYAGIDRSLAANANWRATVIDASPDGGTTAGDLSTSLLYQGDEAYFNLNRQQFWSNPQVNGMSMTTIRMITKYKALFESIDYSSLSTAHFVNQANATGRFGLSGVGFGNVPFVPDANVSSAAGDIADTDRIYAIDMNHLMLATLDSTAVDPDIQMKQQMRGIAAGVPVEGFPVTIEVLGNSGEFVRGYVKTYLQLVTMAPKRAGMVFKNISNALS